MADGRTHRIAVIAGDGVGIEVVEAGLHVLRAAAERHGFTLATDELPWGSAHYRETGAMMPADAIETLRGYDAIYVGAVGSPDVPDDVTLWGLLLPIRQVLDQYVNLRPVRLLPGVESPLRAAEVDMLCVRENTEGEYAGVGGRVHRGLPHEVGIQTDVFTREGVERIARYAFELARRRRGKLTSVTKSNAGRHAFVFWDDVVADVAGDYPEVELERVLVDAAAAYFVTRPESFDVVVGSNLFMDVLTDLGAAIQGGMGLAASANINPDGRSSRHVRAGARIGAGHRRQRRRQPGRRRVGRRADARGPRRGGRGGSRDARDRGRARGARGAHARPRRRRGHRRARRRARGRRARLGLDRRQDPARHARPAPQLDRRAPGRSPQRSPVVALD